MKNKSNYKRIRSVQHLKDTLNGENYEDFIIALNGGAFSRKEIMWDEDGKKFLINNCIDDTEQDLTIKQLNDPKLTNIGMAILKGAFFHVLPPVKTKAQKAKDRKNFVNQFYINAHEAGENDTYVEDRLIESAQQYIDETIPERAKLSKKNLDMIIEAYRDGFLGRKLKLKNYK